MRHSSAAIATCRSGSARSPTCIATSARGRCTACCACAGFRWTTPICSCARIRSSRRSSSCSTSWSWCWGRRSGCRIGSISPPAPTKNSAPTRPRTRRSARPSRGGSTAGPTRPDKKLGTDATWDQAERALEQALKHRGATYRIDQGGGAFYGPKIDIKFNDAIGREWQGATIQLDFEQPERFQLEYTGEDNRPHRPVMIHRAIYGTLERFVGFLIEHFAGAFPLWLAPEQVRVLPISAAQAPAARGLHDRLRAAAIRSSLDERSDTLNYRIRDAELHKVPYMAVVGQREAESGSAAVRARGEGKKQVVLPIDEFVAKLTAEVRTRSLTPLI